MVLVCISNGCNLNISVGKKYISKHEDNIGYLIINDVGDYSLYCKEYFMELSKFRKLKLNNFLS